MIVSEFVGWLLTQDQGATVETLERRQYHGFAGDYYIAVHFNPDDHATSQICEAIPTLSGHHMRIVELY